MIHKKKTAHSAAYTLAKEKIETGRVYAIAEALELAKRTAHAKFNEAVELHVCTGIDPTKGDQQVRGTITFPHNTGAKQKRVIAFVEAEKEAEATAAGADIIGTNERIDHIAKTGEIDFDVAIATPKIMPKLAKLAKILGPRGLMPNPKTDTMGPNITKMIEEQKAGKISFKNDKTGNLHVVFGRVSQESTHLEKNVTAFLDTIKKLKPSGVKGIYLKNAVITTTMGPGIKIEAN